MNKVVEVFTYLSYTVHKFYVNYLTLPSINERPIFPLPDSNAEKGRNKALFLNLGSMTLGGFSDVMTNTLGELLCY